MFWSYYHCITVTSKWHSEITAKDLKVSRLQSEHVSTLVLNRVVTHPPLTKCKVQRLRAMFPGHSGERVVSTNWQIPAALWVLLLDCVVSLNSGSFSNVPCTTFFCFSCASPTQYRIWIQKPTVFEYNSSRGHQQKNWGEPADTVWLIPEKAFGWILHKKEAQLP